MAYAHNPECLQFYGVNIYHDSLSTFPAYKHKWDCAGCAAHQFGLKTNHLATRYTELASTFDLTPAQINAMQERSRVRNLGYLRLSFRHDGRVLIVADPRLLPHVAPFDSICVLQAARDCAVGWEVKRLSLSASWQPPASSSSIIFQVISKIRDYDEYRALLKLACIEPGDDPVTMRRKLENVFDPPSGQGGWNTSR